MANIGHGHYSLEIGSVYHGRYEVISLIDFGSTSSVWAVKNLNTEDEPRLKYLAIKVLDADYHESSELQILQRLSTYDSSHPGYQYVLKVQDSFEIVRDNSDKHVCLVIDLVGRTLQEVQQGASGKVLPLHQAKPYLKQLLLAIEYAHAAGVIHTDIKLDNILIQVVNGAVCLCDWGEAVYPDNITTRRAVQPQCLRAPEVLISAKKVWNSPIDIWNFGALILELVENIRMFDGRNRDGDYDLKEHLQEIVNLFGPLPQSLLDHGDPEIVGNLGLRLSNGADLSDWFHFTGNEDTDALKAFLMEVMVIDSVSRPTATQLIDNVWLKSDES